MIKIILLLVLSACSCKVSVGNANEKEVKKESVISFEELHIRKNNGRYFGFKKIGVIGTKEEVCFASKWKGAYVIPCSFFDAAKVRKEELDANR